MLDTKFWIDKFEDEPGYNDATSYGVEVHNDFSKPGWRVSVHHLTPEENRGNHNIYFRILKADGSISRYQIVGLTWVGMKPHENPVFLRDQKGENEIADFVMFGHLGIEMEILAHCRVSGLTALLPDEEDGNSIGHHSFFVVFRYDQSFIIPPAPDNGSSEPDNDPPDNDPPSRTIRLKASITTNTSEIRVNKAEFSKWFDSLPEDENGMTWFNLLCYSDEMDDIK